MVNVTTPRLTRRFDGLSVIVFGPFAFRRPRLRAVRHSALRAAYDPVDGRGGPASGVGVVAMVIFNHGGS